MATMTTCPSGGVVFCATAKGAKQNINIEHAKRKKWALRIGYLPETGPCAGRDLRSAVAYVINLDVNSRRMRSQRQHQKILFFMKSSSDLGPALKPLREAPVADWRTGDSAAEPR